MALKLAIIGDVHGFWTGADTAYFNASPCDAVLFVGDLAPLIGALPTARKLAALKLPAFLIPGNHDACGALQFLAELRQQLWLASVLSVGQGWRVSALRRALGPVKLAGYSLDLLDWDGRALGLIAARPHSMGGDRLYFRPYLKRAFGIASFEDSLARLRELVDEAPQDIIFLSHNGPAGLGAAREDIWGCDFRIHGGDFGDPDLQDAIRYARSIGKKVHAVIAGHMHHRLKGGGLPRRWQVMRDGVMYLNAARVQRIRLNGKDELHYHVALLLDKDGARAQEMWIDARGERFAATSL